MITTEVVIIGAGPIGLELAVALKKAGIDYLQFDARQIGYTISWFPPQTRFFSSSERIAIAGVPLQTFDQNKCSREEYLAYLRSVCELYDLKINSFEPVTDIRRVGGEGFVLSTLPNAGPAQYRCRKLVLATGGTAKPRMLNVPGENLPHVSHHFGEAHDYFRRRVLIVGGKNSAIEAALRCYRAGAHVALSYRRAALDPRSIKYWLLPEINGLIESGKIQGYYHTEPVSFEQNLVRLRDVQGASQQVVEADAVLLMTGYVADMSMCRCAGVELRGPCDEPVYNPQTMETNVPGVYLAGTVIGGTQDKYNVFIENGHIHVDRIVAALTGAAAPSTPAPQKQPES